MLVHRPSLLVGFTACELAKPIADRTRGKARIERLIEFVHQRAPFGSVRFAGEFPRYVTPGTPETMGKVRHYL